MRDRAEEDARGLAALGAAIRTRRIEAGRRESELALRARIEPAALAEIEDGRQEPTWGELRRIAQGLDESLESLLELAERLEQGDP
ncbi:MAG TPA: helix-turn-helix transcriptional regulator [Solirubrobacterales bacterium]|nr:helix-turn-helix transcriptional regulator [Solirubrobacterales bacterium]